MKKWLDLSEKVVIVTGGSMGIGERIVDNVIKNDGYAIIADIVDSQKFRNNDRVDFIHCDVGDKKSVESMVESVLEKHGKISALINNAGVNRPRMLVDYYGEKPEYELTEDDMDFMYRVNQKGTFLCAQAVARSMVKKEYGVIVNLSSEAGIEGSRGQSAYSGTKAAVHAFTMSWAKELGPYNIRVVGVAPGKNERTPTDTDDKFNVLAYTRGQAANTSIDSLDKIALGRKGKLKEVADLIVYLISDHASYLTGTTINITGGKSTR